MTSDIRSHDVGRVMWTRVWMTLVFLLLVLMIAHTTLLIVRQWHPVEHRYYVCNGDLECKEVATR